MDIVGMLKAFGAAIASGFNYFTKREENKPGQQKRDEIQQIRKEHDENDRLITDFLERGRVPNPKDGTSGDDKRES